VAKSNYSEQAAKLSEAIDIALETLKAFPRIGYQEIHLNIVRDSYLMFKEKTLNPEPQFRNLRSLTQLRNDFLTYFQEGAGEDVEYFWKKIKERQLGYKRENKLLKILKRQRIKDQHEYDFITDVMVPYQQEGFISEEEVEKLNQFLADYELSPKRR
jgi:hypothetical protein